SRVITISLTLRLHAQNAVAGAFGRAIRLRIASETYQCDLSAGDGCGIPGEEWPESSHRPSPRRCGLVRSGPRDVGPHRPEVLRNGYRVGVLGVSLLRID